jgi:hypothetical protein
MDLTPQRTTQSPSPPVRDTRRTPAEEAGRSERPADERAETFPSRSRRRFDDLF